MSCCRSAASNLSKSTVTSPKLKYSFAKNSNVLFNSSTRITYGSGYKDSPDISHTYYSEKEEALDKEFMELEEENQKIDLFIENRIKPLEKEIVYYENQINIRQNEIK